MQVQEQKKEEASLIDLGYLRGNYFDDIPKQSKQRIQKLIQQLSQRVVNLQTLKMLCYMGITDDCRGLRSVCWKVLLNYLPTDRSLWGSTLQKSKQFYQAYCDQLLKPAQLPPQEVLSEEDIVFKLTRQQRKRSSSTLPTSGEENKENIPHYQWQPFFQDHVFWDQIEKDTVRTRAEMNFFVSWTQRPVQYVPPFRTHAQKEKQKRQQQEGIPEDQVVETHFDVLSRILFIYGKLNKQIRYVQGMNEILAPIYYQFCKHFSDEFQQYIESDTYFCFSLIMSEVQDAFIGDCDQFKNGIQNRVMDLNQLLRTTDEELWLYLEKQAVNPHYYSLRWLMLMLTQDFEISNVIRLWDALLSHDHQVEFLNFQCLAIMKLKRQDIMNKDFSVIMEALQNIQQLDPSDILFEANFLYNQAEKDQREKERESKNEKPKENDNSILKQMSNYWNAFTLQK